MMEFFMEMIPPTATHQQQGVTVDRYGVRHFYKRRNGEAEARLAMHLKKHIPETQYTGAIKVTSIWYFQLKGKHKDREPYTNKPDIDNICKALYDIMSRLGYWKDDKQIVKANTEKYWSEKPGIFIRIEEVD